MRLLDRLLRRTPPQTTPEPQPTPAEADEHPSAPGQPPDSDSGKLAGESARRIEPSQDDEREAEA